MNSKSTESLADFVRRVRNEKGFSQPDVEKHSGYTITDGYVSQIENGYIKNVSPEKLVALAKGLKVSEEEVFAVARGLALESPDVKQSVRKSEMQEITDAYLQLHLEDQEVLRPMINFLSTEIGRLAAQRPKESSKQKKERHMRLDKQQAKNLRVDHPGVEHPEGEDVPATDTAETVDEQAKGVKGKGKTVPPSKRSSNGK